MRKGGIWEAIGTIGVIAGMLIGTASEAPIGLAVMGVSLIVFIIGRFL